MADGSLILVSHEEPVRVEAPSGEILRYDAATNAEQLHELERKARMRRLDIGSFTCSADY